MPKVVLYAEDNAEDAFLCQKAVQDLDFVQVRYVPDGRSAVEWLVGDGSFSDRDYFPVPDVLITDLKMPFGTGMDVLKWIRSHPHLKDMKVVVFSGSISPQEMEEAKAAGVTACIQKQTDCAELIEWLRRELDHD